MNLAGGGGAHPVAGPDQCCPSDSFFYPLEKHHALL